jgi:diguanylate cyclase (GGDEF)-like protein
MSKLPVGPEEPQAPPAGTPPEAAHQQLARLGLQVDVIQATLVRLLQDVVRAEARLGDTQAAQLVEANENLVLAALSSQQDPLTQLPNRALLADRFQQCRARARRQGEAFALLFVDLDGFKLLNDAHGHAFGDEVLRWVAGRLTTAVREVDTVSRHGGDEFVILLAELERPADVDTVIAKLKASLSGPVTLAGQEVVLSASIGVAHYPADGEDLDTLLGCADADMYRGKKRGPAPDRRPGTHPPAVAAVDDAQAQADAEASQARLREANEQLLLATLSARELVEAAEFARERQAEVLAAVTEELRNPSAPIRIANAMLGRLDDAAPLLPRVQQIIETQMRHMARLVADLVETSQQEPHALTLDRRPVDMTAVIDAAVETHRGQVASRSQRLSVQLPPPASGPHGASGATGLPRVMGDPASLELIVSNLIDNACRHTSDGGRIALNVSVDDASVQLTVADDGIGITPQMLPYVFEPFLLDAQALGEDGPGLGIGLTVVRALVRAQGGELAVHSAGTRRGSQFVVSLPRVDALQEATDGR